MHIALYREFRPVTFDELIGQDHIVRILKNQIRTENTSHAYLFSGTRGTGKTTTARILAKALNCTGEGEKPCCACESCRAVAEGSSVDVIEMDAASHRGVAEIQELTDSVMYAPTAGKYKVYIIDEVHMLSTEAFNALLKTLEEPPEHVVFILATTEPQKVPATILSRCMKLDFRRVPEKMLTENMRRICESKQIEAEEGALSLIAVNADGSVRDSLSILEQCICPGEPLRRDDVAAVLGTSGVEPLLQLTDLILERNSSGALLLLNEILSAGAETRQFMKEWLGHFRNLLIAKYVKEPSDILNMSAENADRVVEQSGRISRQELERAIRELTETISLTKWAKYPRIMLEMTVVKLSDEQETIPVRDRTSSAGAGSVRKRKETSSASLSPEQTENSPEQIEASPVRIEEPPARMENRRNRDRVPREQIVPPHNTDPDNHHMDPQNSAQNIDKKEEFPEEYPSEEEPAAADSVFSEENWNRAVDRAASEKGILTRLIGRTHFENEKDGKIYISCDDPATVSTLQKTGKVFLEAILEKQTGRRLEIVPEIKKTDRGENRDDREQRKEKLDQFFGMDVMVH